MFTIKFGVTLLYSIPSMVLYLLSVLLLRRFPKEFSASFAKLYITFFIFNTITFFNSFITVRIPQNTCRDCAMSFLFKAHSATNMSWFPLNVFAFIHYSMGYIQFAMIFLTCFDRFSVIFWIKSYEKIRNQAFVLLVIGVILLPVPFTLHVLNAEVYYVYSDPLDCYRIGSSMDRQVVYNELLVCLSGCTVLTAIINVASFFKLSCMAIKISKAERNLLFVSGSLFLVQLVADINITISRFLVNDSNRDTIWAKVSVTSLPYISDGLTLIHPYLFLVFSSKARQCFTHMYIKSPSSLPSSNAIFHAPLVGLK